MIPYDFEYYVPDSVDEAAQWFASLQKQGKSPIYFSGGTEILTFARTNTVRTGAVIDLKALPECNLLELKGSKLEIGACVPLSALTSSNRFPLLGVTAQGVADQTARNKITFGGNLCARIVYRETVLPLLLTDSSVMIAGEKGTRQTSIHEAFKEHLLLQNGEFLVKTLTDRSYLTLPYFHAKRRQIGHVGYPLVTVAALKKDSYLRMALSGVCSYPFRSAVMEEALNDSSMPQAARIEKAIAELPAPVLDDVEGSAAYRKFLLARTMAEAVQALESR